MIVAAILILAASASATPVQPVSTLLACTAAQLSLAFESEGNEFSRRSHSGTQRSLRNFGSRPYAVSGRLSFNFRGGPNSAPRLEAPTSQYLSPALAAFTFKSDILSSSFPVRITDCSGRNARYRFDYLKRDLVYV